jgi:hypothetical protein
MGKIHVIAGYARHRVDGGFHQVYDPKAKSWSQKAAFPLPCNHVAGVSIGPKVYTFGGFVEQNRCPHSKCFTYDTANDAWQPIAGLARPRGAISALVLDGKIHLLGGRDVRPERSLSSVSATTWASPRSTVKSTRLPAAWIPTTSTPA